MCCCIHLRSRAAANGALPGLQAAVKVLKTAEPPIELVGERAVFEIKPPQVGYWLAISPPIGKPLSSPHCCDTVVISGGV